MDGSNRNCNRQTCPHKNKPKEDQPCQDPQQDQASQNSRPCPASCSRPPNVMSLPQVKPEDLQPIGNTCGGPCSQIREREPAQPSANACTGPCSSNMQSEQSPEVAKSSKSPCPAPCRALCADDKNSTQILFVESNFMETPSEYDVFYDCFSDYDVPQEGLNLNSQKSNPDCGINVIEENKSIRYTSATTQNTLNYCTTTETVRKVKKSKSSRSKASAGDSHCHTPKGPSCCANLEITAKVCTDIDSSDQSNPYRLIVDPISITMPIKIQFQPHYKQSNTQIRHCISERGERYLHCESVKPVAPVKVPEVIPIPSIPPTPLIPEIATSLSSNPSWEVDDDCKPKKISEEKIETCPCLQPDLVGVTCPCKVIEEVKEEEKEEEEIVPDKPVVKPKQQKFHLAYPQHKDLALCAPCCFDPSPLIDDEGKVFCPGNCGCCLCPWKPRNTIEEDEALKHEKVRVCRCRGKITLFEDIDLNDPCSNTSYFDLCPCREKAEAKFLEMFGHEMWTANETLDSSHRDKEVSLDECIEIRPKRSVQTDY